jgi:hypothetical protein
MTLYQRGGGEPAPLPFSAYDSTGRVWTDLANNPEGIEACGFVPGPDKPASAIWLQDAWIVVSTPDYDRDTQAITGEIENIDPEAGTAEYAVRDLTEAEIAARNPPPADPAPIFTRFEATIQLDENGMLLKLLCPGDGTQGFYDAGEVAPGDVQLFLYPAPRGPYTVRVQAPGYSSSSYEVDSAGGVVGVRFVCIATGEPGRPAGDFYAEARW